ncbi:4-hydroxythreonine-4-phosphate dehydrogenase PdxA [Acinetobacter sp. B5B]|uniref:4-hydroxythreonine-4-phosphate dehydrogenase PdxA n=1 Tax=Acinetobacter baretiae TaxID=2605383 RepID=UPI0018C2A436|nr:4-hydroxythreonine-4-phosphate dehydrogenase PdxA [Acinetobacter baretiae]MBF7683835.1 4-hydroxythreonine-4-phosphate dehydrogenase PdxA [Acinetobacter baretiae]
MKPLYVTSGEPAGIGPDICLSLAEQVYDRPIVVLADINLMQARAEQLSLKVECIEYVGQSEPAQPHQLYVESVPLAEVVEAGQLNVKNANYVVEQLRRSAQYALSGKSVGIATAPVQKSVINDAGIAFSGHTEFYQEMAGVAQVVMMLATANLRVALVTTHLPLKAVAENITEQRLIQVIDILIDDLKKKFKIIQPRILVCGLNPHAGEGGYLGHEEIDVINPVLMQYRQRGENISLALPADTLFRHDYLKDADAVLAMYHDQGLPVLKSQGFGEAVNITLGLPFIRTSVDHGTALSLAGTGQAKASSLHVAVMLALQLAHDK